MKQLSTLIIAYAFVMALASCTKIVTGERVADRSEWLSAVPDDTPVASITIPGAHDAATYTISTPVVDIFARTQAMTIADQLSYGVRAFDLRPALVDNKLEIYHDKYDTHVSFADAIDTILDFLDSNPSEFAIILIRHETEADGNDAGWSEAMYNILSALPEEKVVREFDPEMTLSQVRGRILFLSRNEYRNGPIGAYITGWYSGEDIQRQKSAKINDGVLWVQDFYDPTGEDDKLDAIKNILDDFSAETTPGIWCINHTSGYTAGIFNAPDYGENAQNVNGRTADLIEGLSGSAGIVLMDFAGSSQYRSYSVYGDRLLDALINHNNPTTRVCRAALHE